MTALIGVSGVPIGWLLWQVAGGSSVGRAREQPVPAVSPLLDPYLTQVMTRDDGTGYKQTMDQIRVMLTKGNLNRFDVEDLVALIQRPTPILGLGDATQSGLTDRELGIFNSSEAALSMTTHYIRSGYPIEADALARFLLLARQLLEHGDPRWRLNGVNACVDLGLLEDDPAVRRKIESIADSDESKIVRNHAHDRLARLGLRAKRLR